MKRYKSLFLFCSLLCFLGNVLSSCSEDQTLEGAKEIYMTISPMNPFIMVGDTVPLSIEVSNLNGKPIDTPVEWLSDDESIIAIYQNAMIARNGAQGKSTKIRAILPNGKFALVTATVTTHNAKEVTALEDIHYTYSKNNDSVWFSINPVELLLDFKPEVKNSNPELIIPSENPIYIDQEAGKVAYVFNSGKVGGKATITLSIGAMGSEKSASSEVVVSPTIISSLSDDFTSITYEYATTMDIYSQDTVWVNTKVDPSYEIDLINAESLYKWKVEGNAAQMVEVGTKVVKNRGHRAYAVIRSGSFTGQTVVKFECNGIELTSTIDVQNYAKQYPVEELSVNQTEIEMPVYSTAYVIPTVIPVSSYGIHLPKFTPKDPSIVEVLGYNGNEMGLKGLRMGETDVVVTSNDKTVTIRVKVTDKVLSVIMRPGNQNAIFESQTTQWFADVNTSSNVPMAAEWLSKDESIATVDAQGVITGHKAGTVNIQAMAGGIFSTPAMLRVIAAPTQDVVYTAANTNLDANAVFVDGKKLIVMLDPLVASPFRAVTIEIEPSAIPTEVVDATYSVPGSQISFVADNASARISEGSVVISAGADEYMKRINADLTVTIGNKSFKVKLTDVEAYI